jgi:hypothetical protein
VLVQVVHLLLLNLLDVVELDQVARFQATQTRQLPSISWTLAASPLAVSWHAEHCSRDSQSSSCSWGTWAATAVSRQNASAGRKTKENTRKSDKTKFSLGNLQLACQGGALSLGLLVAGHQLVVQGGPFLRDHLKRKKERQD